MPRSDDPTQIRSVRVSMTLTLKEAARAVELTVQTLLRRKASGQKLAPVESEKEFRVARVADAATDTLGTREAAGDWLRTSNAALGGVTPLSLLDTDAGANAVLGLLARIEHGVFS